MAFVVSLKLPGRPAIIYESANDRHNGTECAGLNGYGRELTVVAALPAARTAAAGAAIATVLGSARKAEKTSTQHHRGKAAKGRARKAVATHWLGWQPWQSSSSDMRTFITAPEDRKERHCLKSAKTVEHTP